MVRYNITENQPDRPIAPPRVSHWIGASALAGAAALHLVPLAVLLMMGTPPAAALEEAAITVSVDSGGAALATSAVAFGLVIDRKLTFDDHCPDRVCDDIGDDASRSGRVLSYVSAISLAGGVLATATGLYLLWTIPSEGESGPYARVEPVMDRNLLGAQLTGRF